MDVFQVIIKKPVVKLCLFSSDTTEFWWYLLMSWKKKLKCFLKQFLFNFISLCNHSVMLHAVLKDVHVSALGFALVYLSLSPALPLDIILRHLGSAASGSFSVIECCRWLFPCDVTIFTCTDSAYCHLETDHLGGTDVSFKRWEGVNWFIWSFLFSFIHQVVCTVCHRYWENIVTGWYSDLLV